MKILALGMHATAAGELSYEARAVHHIAEMGHEVHYWTDNWLDYGKESVLRKPKNLENFIFHEGARALATTPRRFHPLDLKKIVSAGRYDVIFATATTGIDMGVFAREMLGVPLVVQWLDVPYWRIEEWGPYEIYRHSCVPLPLLPQQLFEGYRNEWAYWFSQLPMIDRVSTILEVTKGQIEEYAQKLKVSRIPEISVTHHGSIDSETMDYLNRTDPVEKKNQVICVNRIDFHKGVDQTVLVCRMIQEMMEGNEPEFVFVSTGNQKWYEDMIKDAAKATLTKVRFTGWIDNVTKFHLIRESKVMLDNEWPEGFGGCNISEAIYSGCVPIVWNRRSKLEVNPIGAIHVPLDDYQAMAENAVKCLTKASAEPYDTSVEAKTFVREKRSINSHAEGLVKAMEEVSGR